MSDGTGRADRPARPERDRLTVLGPATSEEAVALVLVLGALTGGGEDADDEQARTSRWADPGRALRPPPRPGPGGWWASGLPG